MTLQWVSGKGGWGGRTVCTYGNRCVPYFLNLVIMKIFLRKELHLVPTYFCQWKEIWRGFPLLWKKVKNKNWAQSLFTHGAFGSVRRAELLLQVVEVSPQSCFYCMDMSLDIVCVTWYNLVGCFGSGMLKKFHVDQWYLLFCFMPSRLMEMFLLML